MILLTGGSGLLGTELQKHMKFYAPSHEKLDITKMDHPNYLWMKAEMKQEVKLIVHSAAFTDLVRAEKEKELCYNVNVLGTRNLASLGIPMLYISTEYVFDGEKGNYVETDTPNPVNFYSLTKLMGEYESRRTRSVVVRGLFKPRPFKHPDACTDMYTTGDYVDRIAPEIILAIRNFDKLPPTIHIGFERKSIYSLASETRKVNPIKVEDVKTIRLPKDTSLDCSIWNKLKEKFCAD